MDIKAKQNEKHEFVIKVASGEFRSEAPQLKENVSRITGVICGHRV